MFKTICVLILISIPTLIQSTTDPHLVKQSNGLALNLLNVLPQNQNNFYSPLSISYSLYMLLNGANGRTAEELKNLFDLQTNDTITSINENIKNNLISINDKNIEKVILRFANRILLSQMFNLTQSFDDNIKNTFNSSVVLVDFIRDSVDITNNINHWISDQTNGKIDKLFDGFSNDTLLVLSNALYFKAQWDIPFDNYSTYDGIFTNSEGKASKVKMMRQMRKHKYYMSSQLNASLIELKFIRDSNISMIIILPNHLNALNNTIENLNSETLNSNLNELYTSGLRQLNISLPKFQLKTEYDLKPPLESLGLTSLFNSNADLSGITGYNNIRLSDAVHKAVFQLTETGAEAAAVTGMVAIPHIWTPPVTVNVDRPFLFLIQDNKSGLILFLGQVLNI